jgi:hypothetical protein
MKIWYIIENLICSTLFLQTKNKKVNVFLKFRKNKTKITALVCA